MEASVAVTGSAMVMSSRLDVFSAGASGVGLDDMVVCCERMMFVGGLLLR